MPDEFDQFRRQSSLAVADEFDQFKSSAKAPTGPEIAAKARATLRPPKHEIPEMSSQRTWLEKGLGAAPEVGGQIVGGTLGAAASTAVGLGPVPGMVIGGGIGQAAGKAAKTLIAKTGFQPRIYGKPPESRAEAAADIAESGLWGAMTNAITPVAGASYRGAKALLPRLSTSPRLGRVAAKVLGAGDKRILETVKPGGPFIGGRNNRELAEFANKRGVDLLPGDFDTMGAAGTAQSVGERSMYSGKKLRAYTDPQTGERHRKYADAWNRFKETIAPSGKYAGPEESGKAIQAPIKAIKDRVDTRNVDARRVADQVAQDFSDKRIASVNDATEQFARSHSALTSSDEIGAMTQKQTRELAKRLHDRAAVDYAEWEAGPAAKKIDVSKIAAKGESELKNMEEYLRNASPEASSKIKNFYAQMKNLGKPEDVMIDGKMVPMEEVAQMDPRILEGLGINIDLSTREISAKTAQELRSDFLEIARDFSGNFPKNLQRIAGNLADDIGKATDTALPQEANTTWRHYQKTYNDPDSPLYHVLQEPDPSKIPGMLLQRGQAGGSPQTVRLLKQEGIDLGPLRSEVTRQMAGKGFKKGGGFSDDFLQELFGNDYAKVQQLTEQHAGLSGLSKSQKEMADRMASPQSVDEFTRKVATQEEPSKVISYVLEQGYIGGRVERVRALRDAGVPMDALQIQVANDLFDTGFSVGGKGRTGERGGNYSKEFLGELFKDKPGALDEIYNFGKLGRTIKFDFNPSRSGTLLGGMEQVQLPLRAATEVPGGKLGALTKMAGFMWPARVTMNPEFVMKGTGVDPTNLRRFLADQSPKYPKLNAASAAKYKNPKGLARAANALRVMDHDDEEYQRRKVDLRP